MVLLVPACKDVTPTAFCRVLQECLLLKTRPRGITDLDSHLPVVHAHFRLRPVAPAMGGMFVAVIVAPEDVVGFRGDEHFFRAQMFADVGGLHNQAVSWVSVRRTSARTSCSL